MKRLVLFLAAGAVYLTACNNDEIKDIDFQNIESEPQRITLTLPDATVQTYSAATARECYIEHLWVLEYNGNTLVNDTLIKGANIIGNSQAQQLLPQLPFTPTPNNTLVFMANTGISTRTVPLRTLTGYGYNEINSKFSRNKIYYWYSAQSDSLPMYGEMEWKAPFTYMCAMERSVAKIQVRLGENITVMPELGSREYISNSLQFHPMNLHLGFIQPTFPLDSGAFVNFPNETEITYSHFLLQNTDWSEAYQTCYINEVPNTGSYSDFKANRPYILLRLNGYSSSGSIPRDSTQNWRLDFYDPKTKKFIDVKRNHHYIFTINKLYPGYRETTRISAEANPGSNIEYEVTVDNPVLRHITSNGQYAIATSMDTVYLSAGVTASVRFRYILGAGMSLNQVQELLSHSSTAYFRNGILYERISPGTNSLAARLIDESGTAIASTPPTTTPVHGSDWYGKIKETERRIELQMKPDLGFVEAKIKFELGNIIHYVVVKAQ